VSEIEDTEYLVYRELPDGDEEVGILTFGPRGHLYIDVGDWLYVFDIWRSDYPFAIIGEI
jgi:hypothetical protein